MKNTTIYKISIYNDSSKKWERKELDGKAYPFTWHNLTFFAHRPYGYPDSKSWNVSEATTGTSVVHDFQTKKGAIEETIRVLESVGVENTKKAIDRSQNYYLSHS